MNIEEEAKEYRSNTFGTPFGNDIAMAFSEGAEWMLEKAINWLNDKVMFDEVGRPVKIEQFKKVMEE